MVGLVDDYRQVKPGGFRESGDSVILLGPTRQDPSVSEYFAQCHGLDSGPPPPIDLAVELAVQRLCRDLLTGGLALSAHDCSEGGLAVALAECCIAGGKGFEGHPVALRELIDAADRRRDLALFGEGQSRILITCAVEKTTEVLARAAAAKVDALCIGVVGGQLLQWGNVLDTKVSDLEDAWRHGFERLFN
jgi:phosphoribosylformylglycinamidine synthase